MSKGSSNPYAASDEQGFKPPTNSNPGKLKAVGVISLILAAFGIMSGCVQVIGVVFNQLFQSLGTPVTPGNAPNAVRLQQDMQQEIFDMQSQYMPIQLVLAVLLFFIAVGLLIASILLLKQKNFGRQMMLVVCPLVIMLDIARGIVNSIVGYQQTLISAKFVESMAASTGGQAGPPPGLIANIATGFAVFFIGLGACWVVLKVVFYLISIFYLRKPHVAQLFD